MFSKRIPIWYRRPEIANPPVKEEGDEYGAQAQGEAYWREEKYVDKHNLKAEGQIRQMGEADLHLKKGCVT